MIKTNYKDCCGLYIISNLRADGTGPTIAELLRRQVASAPSGYDSMAYTAVTNSSQTGAAAALAAEGFEIAGTFIGNDSNRLTLWLRQRNGKPTPKSRKRPAVGGSLQD